MGLLDDAASAVSGRNHSHSHSHHKSHSKHHHRSRSRSRHRHSHSHGFFGLGNASRGSFFGGDSHYHKHNSSRSSFFGLGNASRGSFFGFGRSPSYYKRSPRGNFMNRAYRQLKRLLRDLVYYAKRHPIKVFMLVIMPLVTGGALTALLARFGLRLPPSVERMLGIAAKTATGGSAGLVGEAVRMVSGGGGDAYGSYRVERGRDGGMQWERRSVERDDWGGGGGWGDGLVSGIGKMFF